LKTDYQQSVAPRHGKPPRERGRSVCKKGNKTVIRKAFTMQVNPDQQEEYHERHSPIWAELEDTLKAHGVHNYSIFLHPETNQLFAYVEIEDEAQWQNIAQTDICQKWWKHMGDIMPSAPDNSPISVDLQEVFHID
jgi:L-rhamnose mutarotase